MEQSYFIGIDVHCQFCEMAVLSPAGKVVLRDRCATSISALRETLAQAPRPCAVVIEEGPMASWLWRGLHARVDAMVVSEPRRNRLISQDGDKGDDLDAEKLAVLYAAVSSSRCTRSRRWARRCSSNRWRCITIGCGNGSAKLTALRTCSGVASEDRPALLSRLPMHEVLPELLQQMWTSYDSLVEQEEQWRQGLIEAARQIEVVRRMQELPGVGWIRAATLFAYLDTPWRFRSREALWKYLGIGLERAHSGNGPEHLRVPKRTHRLLKGTILGAALSAAVRGKTPFADLYRRWLAQGLSARLARRNVARRLAATMWGLWKNGNAYRPEWVGVVVTAKAAVQGSC